MEERVLEGYIRPSTVKIIMNYLAGSKVASVKRRNSLSETVKLEEAITVCLLQYNSFTITFKYHLIKIKGKLWRKISFLYVIIRFIIKIKYNFIFLWAMIIKLPQIYVMFVCFSNHYIYNDSFLNLSVSCIFYCTHMFYLLKDKKLFGKLGGR